MPVLIFLFCLLNAAHVEVGKKTLERNPAGVRRSTPPPSSPELIFHSKNTHFIYSRGSFREGNTSHLTWQSHETYQIFYGMKSDHSPLSVSMVSGSLGGSAPQITGSEGYRYLYFRSNNGGNVLSSNDRFREDWFLSTPVTGDVLWMRLVAQGRKVFLLASTFSNFRFEVSLYVSEDAGHHWTLAMQDIEPEGGAHYLDLAVDGNVIHFVGANGADSSVRSVWYRRAIFSDSGNYYLQEPVTLFAGDAQYPKVIARDGMVHVLWVDQYESPYVMTGDLLHARSTDSGLSWRVQPLTKHHRAIVGLFNSITFDEHHRSRLLVGWGDDRRFAPNSLFPNADLYLEDSDDFGQSWKPARDLTSRDFPSGNIGMLEIYSSGGRVGVFFDENVVGEGGVKKFGSWRLWRVKTLLPR